MEKIHQNCKVCEILYKYIKNEINSDLPSSTYITLLEIHLKYPVSNYNLDAPDNTPLDTPEQGSEGTEVQGNQDKNGSETGVFGSPTPHTYGREYSVYGLREGNIHGETRLHPEPGGSGQRQTRVADQIGRSLPPFSLQSPRPDGPNLPTASIKSALQFLGLPHRTQIVQPSGRRYSSEGTSSYGEQQPLSFQLSGNGIVGSSSQPEVVVPRAPRGFGGIQNPRVGENVQAQPEPLANSSLNEGSGATILSSQGGQEGYALYGDIHYAINQEYPLPRNLGLYYAGYNASFGGLPVTIRMATNIQHFVLDVTLPDRTNITFRPFLNQQN